ncbi:thioredoxin domain-containing protein [Sulfitobacter sp. SK012]|uniref:DUF255 domain-containing protein n=1 Tax=Sulfitobacter sp. SK012 TaxID=1389005 RepID=UPI000E0C3CE7|nr:DUF255 domain-containing protein [Sulfitobacter sp. SK012]AXI47193.1 thioredoxin domain-containing protein [Sulfitobacter sp. SK012]
MKKYLAWTSKIAEHVQGVGRRTLRLGKLIGLFSVMLCNPIDAKAQEPNHLLGAKSPYLLQHLNNPVDWYPWSEEALAKAKEEGKLIFVSVGYSSCHWCHVMAEESFENQALADLLNKNFVSIKIDREARPDLDKQFLSVTEILTGGSGGWPNSVFLTPDGDPFYAGGYFPPNAFRSTLQNVWAAWDENPEFVAQEAAKVATAVANELSQMLSKKTLSASDLEAAALSILPDLDGFYGGYGVAPKFPREALFLFLLDQAERTANPDMLLAVTNMLDGMILGGIQDHLGGGFHRYTIDPEWRAPHFEKMLYTQALTGRLLIRAWSATGEARYRRAAERLFDYVLRDLRDRAGGFYAAQDADSILENGKRAEGAYYKWTQEQIAELNRSNELIGNLFEVDSPDDPNGLGALHLLKHIDAASVELHKDPDVFAAELDAVLGNMRGLLNPILKPKTDQKIILSWNGLMIATLAEASHRLDKPNYYDAAQAAANYVLAEMGGSDGLKRLGIQGTVEGPAQLEDYAAFGLALVALHDYAPTQKSAAAWLDSAEGVLREMINKFSTESGGFKMVEATDGLTKVIPLDDTMIPSGNGLALSLLSQLRSRMREPLFVQTTERLLSAVSGSAINDPADHSSLLSAIAQVVSGSTNTVRYGSGGNVRVEFINHPADDDFEIELTIANGWHVNAHLPLDEYLIPTSLNLEGGADIDATYPNGTVKSLSFSDAPLALYEGVLSFRSKKPEGPNVSPTKAVLTFQACSDEVCLPPEDMVFVLW